MEIGSPKRYGEDAALEAAQRAAAMLEKACLDGQRVPEAARPIVTPRSRAGYRTGRRVAARSVQSSP